MPLKKVVDHRDLMPLRDERINGNTSNVSGSAGDKNFHGDSILMANLSKLMANLSAAGSATQPNRAIIPRMKTSHTLRWGILGTGRIAAKFASELPASRTGNLVATASRSTESAAAFARIHGGEGVTGYEALLSRTDIDAIYNSLPNALHHDWTLAALDAGKHVLCEKPLAL